MFAQLAFLVYSVSILHSVSCVNEDGPFLYKKFPDDFLWGTATSAYQVEGGWNEDGEFYTMVIVFFFVLIPPSSFLSVLLYSCNIQ